MIPSSATSGALSDREIEALELLLDRRVEVGGMPLEALDGFFSALRVGPGRPATPDEYLPLVLGEDGPGWADEEDEKTACTLITGFWHHIGWRLAQPLPDEGADPEGGDSEGDDPDDLLPLLVMPDEDAADAETFPVGAMWAAGFLQGVGLRAEAWERWLEDDEALADDLSDLQRMTVFDDETAASMGVDAEARMTLDERLALLASVPALLADLDMQRREEALATGEPIRRLPMPGRNDPCLCGSGSKWKRCCGSSVH